MMGTAGMHDHTSTTGGRRPATNRRIHRRRPQIRDLLTLLVMLACAAAGAGAAEAQPPRGVHYVYLIRHGMYDRDSVADDRTGNGLNALGREQAQMVGARLAALPVKMHALVCSDFTRARETAAIIGAALGMKPEVDSLVHECAPTSDRTNVTRMGAEERAAQCDSNLAAAWAKYMVPTPNADSHDVVVCHGNVTRWFVTRALGPDTRHWTQMDIANCSITILAVRPDGTTRLVIFSDVGHMPVEKQTWTGRGAGWGSAGRR
jgi:serine/threonine-protein phosphatase PGAM5